MMRRVYLDHAAGRPVDARVIEAMLPYFIQKYGNPSLVHTPGNEAREAIEVAREKVARLIGASKKEEIVFTSGATESNNLALKGVALRNRDRGNHIITSSIEHMSVINVCKDLAKQGFEITYLPVDRYGVVDVEALKKEMTERTVLVSIMYANGEIGTIEPIKEISDVVHDHGALLHVDAVAAAGQIPIDVEAEHVDLLSLSSNDIYGPRGVGALYIRSGTRIMPILQGGGQERGLRSGTENLPGIVGMGKAAEIAGAEMEVESRRLTVLRDRLIRGILETIPVSFLNGHPTNRLPNNANVRFSYIEGEALILSLDMEGVVCSSGSACTSKTLEPSHVLLATGLKHEEAHGSLLFTLGRQNTEEDMEYVLGLLPGIVKRLRVMSPLTPKELVADV
ncbi:MAG: cysteine desulfurase NifS [Candidatus Hadarchaeum sp.]|uniref:cysteine desulfurase NifS n=1 Tax=Candidatus Hadarchaeum sp. TaxID=2883567 RepID=UPI003D0BDCD7